LHRTQERGTHFVVDVSKTKRLGHPPAQTVLDCRPSLFPPQKPELFSGYNLKYHSTLICSWCFCSWNFTNSEVPDQAKFFDRLGERVRKLRKARGLSQEDMISFGFSARHWQQIEAGRPITVTTLLRICEVFRVPVSRLLQGLDKGIY
jgi:DNA-binding XRE family transcriptional regulator